MARVSSCSQTPPESTVFSFRQKKPAETNNESSSKLTRKTGQNSNWKPGFQMLVCCLFSLERPWKNGFIPFYCYGIPLSILDPGIIWKKKKEKFCKSAVLVILLLEPCLQLLWNEINGATSAPSRQQLSSIMKTTHIIRAELVCDE